MSDDALVYLTGFEIHNLAKIEHFVCENLPQIAFITGRNDAGKSSVVHGIMLIFSPGNNPDLLRIGTSEGWGKVTFSDGYTAKKRLFVKKDGSIGYELTVETPAGGVQKEPVEFIRTRLPKSAFNVDEFLKKPVKKQIEFILALMPITFTPDEVNGALAERPIEPVKTVFVDPSLETRSWIERNPEAFAPAPLVTAELDLEGLQRLSDQLYSQRTKLLGMKSDLEGARAVNESGLSNLDEGDWASLRDAYQREIATIDQELRIKQAEIDRVASEQKAVRKRAIDLRIADLTRQIADARVELGQYETEIDQAASADKANAALLTAGGVADLSVKLGVATEKANAQQQEMGRRIAVEEHGRKISAAERSELELTYAIKALSRLRMRKLSDSKIPGLDIRFEKSEPILTIDQVPFDLLNQQKRIFVAVRCLRKAKPLCPLLIVESAELDTDNMLALANGMKDIRAQLVAPRWITGEPLAIMDPDEFQQKLVEKARELVEASEEGA